MDRCEVEKQSEVGSRLSLGDQSLRQLEWLSNRLLANTATSLLTVRPLARLDSACSPLVRHALF